MSKTFTTSDVESHNKPNDLYIIVDEDVYDLTKFQDEHPGMSLSTSLCAIVPNKKIDVTFPTRRKEDPLPCCGQGRQQTVLEVSQRRHPQEVQGQAPCRLSQHQEGRGTSHTACHATRTKGHTFSSSRTCRTGAGGAIRTFWRPGPIC